MGTDVSGAVAVDKYDGGSFALSLTTVRCWMVAGYSSSNAGPSSLHSCAFPAASTARTRHRSSGFPGVPVLFASSFVGEIEVPIVRSVQQTIDPAGKPSAELTWTS